MGVSRPRLVIAGDEKSIDKVIIEHWQEEGFDVRYEAVGEDSKSSLRSIEYYGDTLEHGERYAIICYGKAASAVLGHALSEPLPKLCALVAFYPSQLPDPNSIPPRSLRVQVHLSGEQPFAPRYPSYFYQGTTSGFAQRDLPSYDKISANLSWSRTLDCIRRGFGIEVDLERVWEEHTALEFVAKDATATLKTMVANPYVNHVPTLTGGIGAKDLHRFYDQFFIPGNPPSMTNKLLSRTIGSDRIVDEMLISFSHTQEIPWMLPGVPPTNKKVEVVLVGVVCIRGGKLYHEHLHWDQASVLVQIGLLDSRLGAIGLGKNGVSRLPIMGVETARKVVDEGSVESNELITDW